MKKTLLILSLFMLFSCNAKEKTGPIKEGDYLKDKIEAGTPEAFIKHVYMSVSSGKMTLEEFKKYCSENFIKRYASILSEEYNDIKELDLTKEFTYEIQPIGDKYKVYIGVEGGGISLHIKNFDGHFKFAHHKLD